MNKFDKVLKEAKDDELDIDLGTEDGEDTPKADKEDETGEETTDVKVADVKEFLKNATKKQAEDCKKDADKRLEELGGDTEEKEDDKEDDKAEDDLEGIGENAFDTILKKYGIGIN